MEASKNYFNCECYLSSRGKNSNSCIGKLSAREIHGGSWQDNEVMEGGLGL